ncbi:MAG: UDP-N-acetylglucosamine 1-carboxyvinyltransferase [Candidatus Geothermincolia bacterium]
MDKFVVEGGNRLRGTVKVSGAKNSVLKLMAAVVMAEGPSRITNVPDIADVHVMSEVLRHLGLGVTFQDGTLEVTPASEPKFDAPYHLVQKMRAAVDVLGALLARYGRARVAMPGGDNIGSRQIDMHVKGLTQMGARLGVSHGYIEAEAERLKGTHLYLDFASVGATENLLIAACLAEGRTIIENVAKEPEIVDLADFLSGMGARISGAGSSTLVVDGVETLTGVEHAVIGDRIEAGTFLLAGAVTRGEVKVTGANPAHLEIVCDKMREAGCPVDVEGSDLRARVGGEVRGVEISTLPYPGFPTDLQPMMLALLSTASGTSFVTENIFDNRFMVVDEFNRLGADMKTREHHAIIRGVECLSGAPVTATDVRAGAGLVLAGLIAEGVTEVYEIKHIDRGYENFESKLVSLGARIRRASVDESTW